MNQYIAILVITLAGVTATAKELPEPKYDQFYTDANGSHVETASALIRSVNGETMYKCQTVQAKISKSGSSIGMKNVKKPKRGE